MDTLKDKVKARFHRLSSRELIYGLVAVVICLVAAMAVQLQPEKQEAAAMPARLCHENCKKNLKKVRNIKGFPCFFCIRML